MDELNEPVPADPAPACAPESRTPGADRNDAYADARCAPPSGCWMEWERQVNARVEAVAKLAREERGVLQAWLSAATAEQTAYVKELAAATGRAEASERAVASYHRAAHAMQMQRDRLSTALRALVEMQFPTDGAVYRGSFEHVRREAVWENARVALASLDQQVKETDDGDR